MTTPEEQAEAPVQLPAPPAAGLSAWGTVDASEFSKTHPEDQENLIPSLPGLYVWTYNVPRLLGGGNVQDASRRIDNLLKIVGRSQSQKVGPYSHVTIRDERQAINLGRREILYERFAAEDEFGRWIAGLAVHIQRPLYVGKAVNLKKRINLHLKGKTNLRGYVMDRNDAAGKPEFEANMLDLVITWYAAPSALWQLTTVEGEPDGAGEAEAGQGAAWEESEGEIDESEEQVDGGQQEPTVQVSKELEDWLYAGESLLIRLAMPMLNETQS